MFEGHYHYGLAALINSLVKSGFIGLVCVGYRGTLPPWVNQLTCLASAEKYEVASGVQIEFVYLDTDTHFTNFKPDFMLQSIQRHPNCENIWYFDPDIVLYDSWSFFAKWVKYGVALCEEVTNGRMPFNHPIRCKWIELASKIGLDSPDLVESYYNGGFVGVSRKHLYFLELWQAVMRLAESEGADTRNFGQGTRADPFYGSDQDAMNIAAMYCRHPLSTIGAQGMDLVPGVNTMSHAIGSPKPWRKKMIRSSLRAMPPSRSDKAFLANAIYPISPFRRSQLLRKHISCSVGDFIGRFYYRR